MAYIAADIGASSGRVVLGFIRKDKLSLKEIHRFENRTVKKGGHLFWDIENTFNEIMKGILKADAPVKSAGADTWGVDYALLDASGRLVSDIYSYRDSRTKGLPDTLDQKWLYEKTGIQTAPYNTLYQLIAHRDKNAARFLTVPDYLHYRLSGQAVCEYTAATTTQLINIKTGKWDNELIDLTGFPAGIFPEITKPGTHIGNMLEKRDIKVVIPASHDTASAVAAVPSPAGSGGFAFISSGTWSLMGVEKDSPVTSDPSFTNEGGVFGTYRVLKNIMGLWMIQEVRRLLPREYSFQELARLAETPFGPVVDVNDLRFLNPENMIDEIKAACADAGAPKIPELPGELARCVFDSLALCYKNTLAEIMKFARADKLHIIGGGCQNSLLNRLTRDAAGCDVYSGPAEASAAGNILMQMISLGEVKDLNEGRELVRRSFPPEACR